MDRTGSWDVFVQQGVYQELVSIRQEPVVSREATTAVITRHTKVTQMFSDSQAAEETRSVTLNSFLNTSDSSSVSQRQLM